MPTTSQPERSAEVVPQKPNSSAGLPFVVGQVVVTKLPEFAFMHSDGGGMVKLEAVAAQTPSETPDKDSEKEDEWSVSEKETAPRDDKRPQGPEVVSAN